MISRLISASSSGHKISGNNRSYPAFYGFPGSKSRENRRSAQICNHTGATSNGKQTDGGSKTGVEAWGQGGVLTLTGGAGIEKGNPENLRAMTEAFLEYGFY